MVRAGPLDHRGDEQGQPDGLGDVHAGCLQGDGEAVGPAEGTVLVEGVEADDERVRTQHALPAHRVGPLLLQGQGDDASLMNDQLVGDD